MWFFQEPFIKKNNGSQILQSPPTIGDPPEMGGSKTPEIVRCHETFVFQVIQLFQHGDPQV